MYVRCKDVMPSVLRIHGKISLKDYMASLTPRKDFTSSCSALQVTQLSVGKVQAPQSLLNRSESVVMTVFCESQNDTSQHLDFAVTLPGLVNETSNPSITVRVCTVYRKTLFQLSRPLFGSCHK